MNSAQILTKPKQAYPSPALMEALNGSGDYVYAYYGNSENPAAPFYVGKGSGDRVLQHWANAANPKLGDDSLHEQEKIIRSILANGELPVVKLLAYNVETTKGKDIYSLVERVIQDAFGIQRVWKKNPGLSDRVIELPASSLVQVRSDSSKTPVHTLEALIGLKAGYGTAEKKELAEIAGAPVLLVGLSKTYHPSFSPDQLADMARMYWNLNGTDEVPMYRNTTYPVLRKHPGPVLLAWYSFNGTPTIVGAWRIKRKSFTDTATNPARQMCRVLGPDLQLRRDFIGLRLDGKGTDYQGPQIILPLEH